MDGKEVSPVPPMDRQLQTIALQSCTATWPQTERSQSRSTPRSKFTLVDLTLTFPRGELSLVCGKLGSGKTLLLLGTFAGNNFKLYVNEVNSIIGRGRHPCRTGVLPPFSSRCPCLLCRGPHFRGKLDCTGDMRLCSTG